MSGCCFSLVFIVGAFVSSIGDKNVLSDWPQFQGPNRNGISLETGLATKWPEAGPPTLWQVALDPGYSGPSVKDGKVFLLERKNNAKDVLRCFDLQTGKEEFSVSCDSPGGTSYNGSRMPVTIDKGRVYGVGQMGDCYCFDIAKKALVWRRNLPKDFKIDLTRPNESCWGMAQAPILHSNLLVVGLQCADKSMAALNPDTGETIWTAEQLGYQDYTVPALATIGGVEQLVMAGGAKAHLKAAPSGTIAGISLKDGSTLWSVKDLWKCYTPVSPIVPLSEDRLVLSGGYDAGTAMLEVKKEGEGFTVKKLWHQTSCGSQIHMPIAFDGCLYENTCENHHDKGMVCLSLENGDIKWSTKEAKSTRRFERGPLLIADGMILNLSDVTGVLCLIKPTPDGYKELAAAKVLDGNQLWACMAFSQGKLLVRSLTRMKCLDMRAVETPKPEETKTKTPKPEATKTEPAPSKK
jgi:outer membrane protein assembly factor BamB